MDNIWRIHKGLIIGEEYVDLRIHDCFWNIVSLASILIAEVLRSCSITREEYASLMILYLLLLVEDFHISCKGWIAPRNLRYSHMAEIIGYLQFNISGFFTTLLQVNLFKDDLVPNMAKTSYQECSEFLQMNRLSVTIDWSFSGGAPGLFCRNNWEFDLWL